MRRAYLLAVPLLIAAMTTAAGAARIEAVALAGGKQVIALSGAIVDGDAQRFDAAIAQAPRAAVVLASPGGTVVPALAIGSRIRAAGLKTVVADGARCASACALIWLGGSTRVLVGSGRIGLHAMSVVQAGSSVETHTRDDMLRRYLTQLGYSLDTTAVIVNTPASMVRWMDSAELNAAGITTDAIR